MVNSGLVTTAGIIPVKLCAARRKQLPVGVGEAPGPHRRHDEEAHGDEIDERDRSDDNPRAHALATQDQKIPEHCCPGEYVFAAFDCEQEEQRKQPHSASIETIEGPKQERRRHRLEMKVEKLRTVQRRVQEVGEDDNDRSPGRTAVGRQSGTVGWPRTRAEAPAARAGCWRQDEARRTATARRVRIRRGCAVHSNSPRESARCSGTDDRGGRCRTGCRAARDPSCRR